MKVLLIDDKSQKGWKQLLEKLFPIQGVIIESAENIEIVSDKLKNKYDLIFLDIRLEGKDHHINKVEDFSGYKILKTIKENFTNINFSTPIILITASNKIWNIDVFMDYGVDAYYIKEHPSNVFDKETSLNKYNKFKNDFEHLITISPVRHKTWQNSVEIINILERKIYFKNGSGYENVKERIINKLKLGYYYRFKNPNSLERDILKADNEAFAFLIYFSIFEEIVKGFTERNTWNIKGEFSGRWQFRNGCDYIYTDTNHIEVEPYWNDSLKRYVKGKLDLNSSKYESANFINLSEQVYALFYHYKLDDNYKNKFKGLNNFRNKLNYTHSSINAIYNKPLVDKSLKKEFSSNILEILKLIKVILNSSN